VASPKPDVPSRELLESELERTQIRSRFFQALRTTLGSHYIEASDGATNATLVTTDVTIVEKNTYIVTSKTTAEKSYKDYRVVLVSGHHADAHSDLYDVRHNHDDAFAQYLVNVVAQSDFVAGEEVVASPEQNYVMLSTCSYVFDNARYVLHGMLVPVASVPER
jgi:hypothetical protein